jgi:hypothetical protein
MLDNDASIQRREFGGNAADEVPGATPAGEKVGDGEARLLDEMLDIFASGHFKKLW